MNTSSVEVYYSAYIRDVFQILHLVRDPRAIYHSMSRNPGIWKAHIRDKGLLCGRMKDDLAFVKQLDTLRSAFISI